MLFSNLGFYLILAIVAPLFTAFLLLLIFTSPIWFFLTLPYHIGQRGREQQPVIALD